MHFFDLRKEVVHTHVQINNKGFHTNSHVYQTKVLKIEKLGTSNNIHSFSLFVQMFKE